MTAQAATEPGAQRATREPATVLMLLSNAYDPDPRVRQEALTLLGMGCRVRILAWDRDLKSPRSECIEGVEIERLQLASRHGRGATQMLFYLLLYLRMIWRAWRTPFDVAHCHDLDTLPAGFVISALKRKPVVYDAHEHFTEMLTGSVPAIIRRGLFMLENFLLRRVDLLITVGEKLRRHFEDRGAERSVVIGNWKRLEEFRCDKNSNAETRRKHGIPQDALLIACVTQLLPDRMLEPLLEAAESCSDVYVLIAGKGALEDRVRRAAANPRIVYAGFVTGKEIANYTCAADAIYYGFDPKNPNARYSAPNKLYEALAAGKPLITGDFGEIAEIAKNARCGIVLAEYTAQNVGEAFRALQDPAFRRQLGDNAAREGRLSMNWDKAEETLYREYSRLMPGAVREPKSGNDLLKVVAG